MTVGAFTSSAFSRRVDALFATKPPPGWYGYDPRNHLFYYNGRDGVRKNVSTIGFPEVVDGVARIKGVNGSVFGSDGRVTFEYSGNVQNWRTGELVEDNLQATLKRRRAVYEVEAELAGFVLAAFGGELVGAAAAFAESALAVADTAEVVAGVAELAEAAEVAGSFEYTAEGVEAAVNETMGSLNFVSAEQASITGRAAKYLVRGAAKASGRSEEEVAEVFGKILKAKLPLIREGNRAFSLVQYTKDVKNNTVFTEEGAIDLLSSVLGNVGVEGAVAAGADRTAATLFVPIVASSSGEAAKTARHCASDGLGTRTCAAAAATTFTVDALDDLGGGFVPNRITERASQKVINRIQRTGKHETRAPEPSSTPWHSEPAPRARPVAPNNGPRPDTPESQQAKQAPIVSESAGIEVKGDAFR